MSRSGRPPKRGRVFRNNVDRKSAQWNRLNERLMQLNQNAFVFREMTIFDPNFDERSVPQMSIGEMNIRCNHCLALHFIDETVQDHFNNCCHNGLISLPDPKVNDSLKELFSTNRKFLNDIRTYNSSMAFASFCQNMFAGQVLSEVNF